MAKKGRRASRHLLHRSGFEDTVVAELKSREIEFKYESLKLRYVLPERTYTPDLVFPSGIIIELKGYFSPEDRTKMRAVKVAYPELDIRMVFMNGDRKISKTSKLTYGTWCEKYGFPWATWPNIPEEWLR